MKDVAAPASGPSVRCVIIPLEGGAVLLPNTAIAEVVGYREPKPISPAPSWCLGSIQWRGVSVPLISFETVVGGLLGEIGHRARIILIYGLGEKRGKVPYYGLLAQGIPRLSRVVAEGIQPSPDGGVEHEAIAASVVVDGVAAWIPNMDVLTALMEEISL